MKRTLNIFSKTVSCYTVKFQDPKGLTGIKSAKRIASRNLRSWSKDHISSEAMWHKPREPERRRGEETTSVRSSQGANVKSKILEHNLQFVLTLNQLRA